MKYIGKRLTALMLCCAATGTAAYASSNYKDVRIRFSDIKLVVDGERVTPKDANGDTVEPFIYNGSTYLPVRAVADAIGKDVAWDSATKTVYIGKTPEQEDLTPSDGSNYTAYTGDSTKYFDMMGKHYTKGVYFWTTGSVVYDLNGKFSKIEFDVGHVDSRDRYDSEIYVYADDKLVEEIDVSGSMQTKHYTVSVDNASQLKISKVGSGGYAIANLIGKK